MSKKEWIGAFAIAGLYLIGKQMMSNDTPKEAHASAPPAKTPPSIVRPVAYDGPQLARTDWVTQNQKDPMTGESSYYTVLMSSGSDDSKAGLGFKCETEASLELAVLDTSDDISSQDHINFDVKAGDGRIFQVFGMKIGTDDRGTIFQLEEDKLEDQVADGVPLYLRYTIGRRVRTILFVPNNSQKALAPIKACKH